MPTIVTGNGGRKHWRRKAVLQECLRSFEEKERRIIKKNGWEAQRFKTLIKRIQEDIKRRPNGHDLGRRRESLFDKAVRELTGQHLKDKVIIGCIAHGDLSFANIMEHVDRSIIVVGSNGLQVYNFNITGPKWIERHIRSRPQVGVVPVRLETERDRASEEVSIFCIKECVIKFIEADSN